ncbi:MAG: azurin [Pseudomonadota bacterium]
MKTTAKILFALLVLQAQAAACEFDIEVGDNLQFSVTEMTVEASCESVTVNLNHTGSLPVTAMGHNWVLTKGADLQPVAVDGMGAGADASYLKPDDDRVIAATTLVGGGESTSVTFSIADLDPAGDYQFFCSFPGHWSVMKGAFKIV